MGNRFPAIGEIKDFRSMRVALLQGQQIVSAPLSSLLSTVLDSINGEAELLSGDMQDTGLDRVLFSGDAAGFEVGLSG